MAIPSVQICVRVTEDGKRRWVRVTEDCGMASYYLLWYETGVPVRPFVGNSYGEAEIALVKQERKFQAAAIGAVIPEEKPVAPAPKMHRWQDVLAAYSAMLTNKTKKNGWKYREGSIVERAACVTEFAEEVVKKPYVEQYTTADMLAYKEWLYGKGLSSETVLNKLSVVVTWLKKNPVLSITGLLPAEERPDRKEPEPRPWTDAEVDAQMAKNIHRLLIRLALSAGMRKMELAHAMRSDIDPINKTIFVQEKKQYDWVPKTKRGVRRIPLGDNLVRDLLAMPDGLFWPNASGYPDIRIDRKFEEVGRAADVVSGGGLGWVHRWRDTTATRQLEAGLLRERDLNRYMGWEGQGGEHSPMLGHYARYAPYDDPDVRRAANLLDAFGEPEAGIRLVKRA